MFKLFENLITDSDALNSNIFKGQILMTSTTILILTNSKDEFPNIFLNFINNVLIEHIKNTNNYANIYLRQISCQCLEELENEYPGLLFTLLGKKSLDYLNVKESFNDNKSISTSKSTKNKNELPVFDKKLDLESRLNSNIDDGLYNLIVDETFYVFQYYLSLYTTIFKHLIAHVIFLK